MCGGMEHHTFSFILSSLLRLFKFQIHTALNA